MGTFLGTLVRSEAQANGLSILIGMVMALLAMVSRGQGVAAVLTPAAVLMGFAAVKAC